MNIFTSMNAGMRPLQRFLRRPWVIVAELALLALACSAGASLPQRGTATPAELTHWLESARWFRPVISGLALDHVFQSAWFVGLTLLLGGSLTVVVAEQLARVRRQWSLRLTEAHFRHAPWQAEFVRARGSSIDPRGLENAGFRTWTERRVGMLGSPVFHLGVLLVILAGACRGLFACQASVDLIEGETLAPTASAWPVQWTGACGQLFSLRQPLVLERVHFQRFENGDLREFTVKLTVTETSRPPRSVELAGHRDLSLRGGRVFLGSDFGPAAMLTWSRRGQALVREAAMMTERSGGAFAGVSRGPDGLVAHVRAQLRADGVHADRVEVRVMRQGALVFAGELAPGQRISLGAGRQLALAGTPFWARLRGSRDGALGLAYTGFLLITAGVILIFGMVKRDIAVRVVPAGDVERVWVALRPERWAPLFQERFEQLVMELKRERRPAKTAAPGIPKGEQTRPAAVHRPHPQPVLMALLAGALLAGNGCQRSALADARHMVIRYNEVVAEAYRRADVKLIDPVVGIREGRKLTGLIGVRLDLGVTLDAELLSLEVTGLDQSQPGQWLVQTKESWRYRDRRIGTGERVGEESVDHYEMLYVIKREKKAWLVEEIQFRSPPQIGRRQPLWNPGTERAPQNAQPSLVSKEKEHP